MPRMTHPARSGVLAAALGVVLIATLAGCAPPVREAGTTPSPRPTPSLSATPTPTKPALTDLVVTPDGLSYLVVGRPVPTVPQPLALVSYDSTKCVDAGNGITEGSPGAGAWLATYGNGDFAIGNWPPFDVGPVQGATDPIKVIEIWSPQLQTAKHVGVGSTPAQLSAAYGSNLVVDTADNSDVYVLRGSRSMLLFEVAKEASGLDAATIGTVAWMRIVPLDRAFLHIANSEAAGYCQE